MYGKYNIVMDNNTFIENTLKKLIELQRIPNIQLICPDDLIINKFVCNITQSYNTSDEYIFKIRLIDMQNEQIIINHIVSFCGLKSLVMENDKLKILIIYQYSESLSENITNIIEDVMKNENIRLILVTSNFHITPEIIKSRILSLAVKPNQKIIHNINFHKNDFFYEIINSSKLKDKRLAILVKEWCTLNSMRTSDALHSEWLDIIKDEIKNS